jgi:hypothetical protein
MVDGGAKPADAAAAGLDAAADAATTATRFSFFVTSIQAMRELSGSQDGFGGDLRFNERTGLAGADKICRTIAEKSLPGAGQKTWRAFLSASTGGANGGPVNAIDRVGEGPWYDRRGLLMAMNRLGLLAGPRPNGDARITSDLPNERGEPNHGGTDNHDTLTGTNKQGHYGGGGAGSTCNDWTTKVGATGRPMVGHAWPRNPGNLSNGGNWMSDHTAPGCAAGVNITSGGGSIPASVGGGGGYGAIYCFALTP